MQAAASAAPADQALEQAADWFLLLADADTLDNRRRWQQWHDAHPAHRAAWDKVERLQSLLAAAPRQTQQLLDQAGRKSRRQVLAVLGLFVAGGAGYALLPAPAGPAMASIDWIVAGAGAQREVALPDGGRIWLAAGTRVGIAYAERQRDLYLSEGVLQLTSGRDPQGRPLRILARDGVIRPLGTRLTVSQFDGRSVLAVQQHAAEVKPLHGSLVRVEAGQRVVFSPQASSRPEKTLFPEDAWTSGLLSVLHMPLTEFAERYALYTGQRIAVAPALVLQRVSGTFRIDAPERSLHTLADALALRLERSGDGQGWQLRPR